MGKYQTLAEVVRRERETETLVRAMDASEIVTWIHRLEDALSDANTPTDPDKEQP